MQLIHLHENGENVPDIDDITPTEWAVLLAMGARKRQDYYGVLLRKHHTIKNEKVNLWSNVPIR